MQVRVFEADNMQSALRRVKQELGPRAIIISTRTVRKGKAGVFNKPKLEVTAALETENEEEPTDSSKSAASPPVAAARAQSVYGKHQAGQDTERSVPEPGPQEVQGPRSASEQGPAAETGSMETIQGELAELRQMVKDLRASGVPTGMPSGRGETGEARQTGEAGDPVLNTLLQGGVEWETACRVAVRHERRFGQGQSLENGQLREGIKTVLAEMISTGDPFRGWREQEKKRIALIGPTGVGKTTTIAKIAANYLSRVSPKIALVTVDNYRIAAVEQLRVYAEIMNLPLEVVTRQEEIPGKMARHEDKDLILVDTAGRSPQDETSLRELSGFLSSETGVENYLLLSASTKEQDMQRSIRSFQSLGLNGLVFTKLDECEDYGALFNVHLRNDLPLSYFTTGQKVPEDLMVADGRYLAERIIDQEREASDAHQ